MVYLQPHREEEDTLYGISSTYAWAAKLRHRKMTTSAGHLTSFDHLSRLQFENADADGGASARKVLAGERGLL